MKKFIKSSYFGLILLFIYLPIFIMIMFSFNSGDSLNEWQGFSLKWYEYFLSNSPFIKSIIVSLFVAMVSTLISVVVGVMAVVGLAKIKLKARNNWVKVANIPLVNADVITAVGLMILFIMSGVKFGILTLIAAHVSFNVPYVIISVLPFMLRMDKNIIDASKDLGGSSTQTFYKVVIPLLTPAIITATAICFAMSFDDFIISYFTGGGQTNVSTFIYTAKRMQPYINAFGTILVAIIVIVILIWNAFSIAFEKNKQIKSEIKNGEYKLKKINQLTLEIKYYQWCLENNKKYRFSKNPIKWIDYKILQLKIKRLENKNTDAKISKLEWKKELISKEIRSEKRIFSIFKKLNDKKEQLEIKLSKSKNEKRNKKLEQIISKIDKRIDKYQKEIDWINERNNYDKERAQLILEEISELKTELANIENPSAKEVNWYKKKISKLTTKRLELLEGRNNSKLRLTIEKLAEVKVSNENKLRKTFEKLTLAKTKVIKEVSLTERIDKKIANLESKKENINDFDQAYNDLLILQKEALDNKRDQFKIKKLKVENQLEELTRKINSKKEKLFPHLTSDDYVPKSNTWVKRNWKQVSLATSVLLAFSLVTTAYVLNNIYDLVIGNWGSYIDPTLIRKFEKEYDVKVNYQQYDSNESLYNKNYTFSYDLMVPSDYMIKKMAEENLLEPLDWDKITTVESYEKTNCSSNKQTLQDSSKVHVDCELQKVMKETKINTEDGGPKDLTNYALPWFWGDISIVFNMENQKLVDWLNQNHKGLIKDDNTMESTLLSWDILWEAAAAGFNLALNEDPKNVFMYAFEKLYGNVQYDLNNKVPVKEQIDNAAKELNQLLKYSNVGLYGDQLTDKARNGQYDIAVMYNGDIIYSFEDENGEPNQNFIAAVPEAQEQGTNVWSDNLVINKQNRSLDLSYAFINFIYKEEHQIAQFNETGMTTGIQEVNDEVKKGYEGSQFEKIYQPFSGDTAQPFGHDTKWDNYLVDKFNEIIAQKH